MRVPVTVLAVEGDLDGSNFEELIDRAQVEYQGGARHMLIDLSGVPYMSSAGLVALHSVTLLLRGQPLPNPEDGWGALHDITTEAAGGPQQAVKLAGARPKVDRLLRMAGMDQHFEIHPDRQTALATF